MVADIKHVMTLEKLIAIIVMIFALFPYSPPLLASSTQPWAPAFVVLLSLFSFVSLAKNRAALVKKVNITLLCVLFLFFLLQLIKTKVVSIFIIYILKYCIAILFVWFGYSWLKRLHSNILFIGILLWVVAGILQLFAPTILYSVVSGQEISVGRGMPAFAPEPSFFAIHFSLIFLILFRMWKLEKLTKSKYLSSIFLIFCGLALSASGTSIIAMAFVSVVLFYDERIMKSSIARKLTMGVAVLLVVAVVNFSGILDADTRLAELIQDSMSGDIASDASLMTRVYYVLIGFVAIVDGNLSGFAFMEFQNNGISIFRNVPSIVVDASVLIDAKSDGKIQSLFTNLILDFGLVMLLIICYIIYRIACRLNEFSQLLFLGKCAVLLFLVFLTFLPMPIGSPLYFSVIGFYLSSKNVTKTKVNIQSDRTYNQQNAY